MTNLVKKLKVEVGLLWGGGQKAPPPPALLELKEDILISNKRPSGPRT